MFVFIILLVLYVHLLFIFFMTEAVRYYFSWWFQFFSGYYDTSSGQKQDAGSYHNIAKDIGIPEFRILFVTDIAAGVKRIEINSAVLFQ